MYDEEGNTFFVFDYYWDDVVYDDALFGAVEVEADAIFAILTHIRSYTS
jgi:hypothetical protein